jgi:alkanesulfonate monooxygenase SsuD/methylene tetrahydromethanopterin reductase-like flavin-dependent oxidoreductase (luciferase family)
MEFYTILGDKKEVDRVVADTARRTGQDESFIRSWQPFHGDADHIAERIKAYVDVGVQYFVINLPNAFEEGAITRFAEEVFPRIGLQAAARP